MSTLQFGFDSVSPLTVTQPVSIIIAHVSFVAMRQCTSAGSSRPGSGGAVRRSRGASRPPGEALGRARRAAPGALGAPPRRVTRAAVRWGVMLGSPECSAAEPARTARRPTGRVWGAYPSPTNASATDTASTAIARMVELRPHVPASTPKLIDETNSVLVDSTLRRRSLITESSEISKLK